MTARHELDGPCELWSITYRRADLPGGGWDHEVELVLELEHGKSVTATFHNVAEFEFSPNASNLPVVLEVRSIRDRQLDRLNWLVQDADQDGVVRFLCERIELA